ncbi:GDSL-type esterase/lipase family protein [Ornithinibacillus californiensis]|uniref:GDSL-type esterase/lipase family protein n=1 Tax=Ornithinibacillus californiensis TaxID=161536 RepID=UPI00064DD973|nr:GDSL-type esterase/lipase family protein [Ornithinibacillus californiensis]
MKKRIVCFGDSNTWGFNAEDMTRFSEEIRWPCRLQINLGGDYQVIEEGLSGRTSVMDDPLFEGLNGLIYLHPCLMSHAPLDFVIIMLGTNDTKERFGLTAFNIAQGITRLALKASTTPAGRNGGYPRVLVLAPPPIGKGYYDTEVRYPMGDNCDIKSEALPTYLKEMLQNENIEYLNLGKQVSMNTIDYMHLDEDGHKLTAELVHIKIKEMLGEDYYV